MIAVNFCELRSRYALSLAVRARCDPYSRERLAAEANHHTAIHAMMIWAKIIVGKDGASGGVGSFAVQIAKSFSTEVTAVCSTRNVDTMRAIGADHVVDYSRENFADGATRYDLILAANGDRSIWDYKRALTDHGSYVMSGGSNRQLTQALLIAPFLSRSGQKFGNLLMTPSQRDLLFLRDLLETGKLKPLIARSFTLADVPEAVRYVEAGHAAGKAVVTVA